MDWLRVIGVLMIIPFHTLVMFNLAPWATMYVKNDVNVPLFNILQSIIHTFHMPLLFMLSGMSIYLSLQTRSPKVFITERFKKLLIPALFGCCLLNPLMTYIYFIFSDQKSSLIMHYIRFFTTNPGDLSGINGGFTPAHLWFALFLFVFSLVGLPLFTRLEKNNNFLRRSSLTTFFEKPFMLMLLIIPISLAATINLLDDKNPIVYFLIVFLGFLLATHENFQSALNRDKWAYLIISLISIILTINLPSDGSSWSLMWIIYKLISSTAQIVPVFACLGIANCYFNKPSTLLSYLSKASFPIYVIHMLINTLVGYFILPLLINPLLKLMLIILITYALCFLCYELSRKSQLLCFLLAIKHTSTPNRLQPKSTTQV